MCPIDAQNFASLEELNQHISSHYTDEGRNKSFEETDDRRTSVDSNGQPTSSTDRGRASKIEIERGGRGTRAENGT